MDNDNITNKKKYLIVLCYALSLIIFAFLVDNPKNIFKGLYLILIEPDILITDYIGVGGMGATFLNSGILMILALFMLYKCRININGVSIACLFLVAGFSMFGKNIFNVWFIIGGVYIYARIQKDKFSKYIYIALFGTCLSPMVTQIMFGIDKPLMVRVPVAILVGISIGIILPPLSAYLIRVHQGFNLYNIGFVAGIIGTIFVSVFKSYGFLPESRLIWTTENNVILSIYLFTMFILMIFIGFYLNDKSFKNLRNIYSYPGRAVTDFILLEGFGPTLINMGINGLIGVIYILIVDGDLNGPIIGGIFTLVGFGAFGKHGKNMLPIFLGVYLGSLTKIWSINDPSILLAALFGTTLAPIAGEFGWKYGILAGFIHSSVVLNVGVLHGGLNLYNNGFAGGIVAATLVPVIEAFRKEEV
ncbi:MAG: DUF1576 domain-containing protein [Anaeromicrobium sp.]|jgi:hypothetical protein|uniref:DUF1576 domain-containing protein n=1 Tax=Anaeromicrobium sp. TaxID=1929132 RepID=UPI0025FBB1F5|nr:DUF1576 domain-containing protein [Anaeromicrobium sp.]MCT4595686.1 DUF1576 domain-containing protein [Anaeromicrobium sp.]